MEKIEGNKYALHNSYFKNKKQGSPDTLLEIVQYWKLYGELPFNYTGDDWLYQTVIERQKKRGVILSQYPTPDCLAQKVADLTDNFNPEGLKVLDACCGTGQLAKYLLAKGLKTEGFDIDKEMIEICKILYPEGQFYEYDFTDGLSDRQWDLIIANPPFEQKSMKSFLFWLKSALCEKGKAIILMPSGFTDKKHSPEIRKVLDSLSCLHRETVTDIFTGTKVSSEILILGKKQKPEQQIVLHNQIIKTNLMEAEKICMVGLDSIIPNPNNSRKKFNQEELNELAHSIKEHGLLHPITLRPKGQAYEIVYGERRYRAYKLNGESLIPAIIREYSDEQILEITLVENINRKDLTAIEESDAYQQLLDTGKYTIDDISHKTGKNDSYIRSRLRLQNLIGEFKKLLDTGDITIGVGFETAKFTKQVQKQIYREHFLPQENNWKDLGLKEYTERIEKLYTNDLSKFNFDKGECEKCQSNTALYDLFPGKSGKCMNGDCLLKKKNKFTVNFCKALSEQYPGMEVCIAPYDKMNKDIDNSLSAIGVRIKTLKIEEYPVMPPPPQRSDYPTEEEYLGAADEYNIEEMAFYKEVDEIEEKIQKGELKKVIYIGDNNPIVGYVKVLENSKSDPLETLQKQDAENKAIATKNAAKEVALLLQSAEVTGNGLTVFEDELVLFVMLDSLDRKYFPAVGIDEEDKQMLTDKEKYKIVKSATSEQKVLILRNFLIRSMTILNSVDLKTMLLIEFSKQHFEEQTSDILRKHTDIYNQKYQKIQKQIERLKTQEAVEVV